MEDGGGGKGEGGERRRVRRRRRWGRKRVPTFLFMRAISRRTAFHFPFSDRNTTSWLSSRFTS
jgi:hypothetical protein